jgi:ABC-type Fe3+ transport system substrate-binding protein
MFMPSPGRPRTVCAAFICLILAACGGGSAPASSAPPQSSAPAAKPAASGSTAPDGSTAAAAVKPVSQENWDDVLAAAKKEGHVIVWGAAGPAAKVVEKDAFEKAYPGIQVDLFQANTTSERDTRYVQEFKAGVAKVDVLIGGTGGVKATIMPVNGLQDENPYLRPETLDPKVWLGNAPLWVDADKKYMLMSDAAVQVSALLGSSVNESEVQSWSDLTNPKWKGKIVMTDPRESGAGFGAALFFWGTDALGANFTKDFYPNVVFSSDERQNVEWVDSGKMLINVSAQPVQVDGLLKVGSKAKPVHALKVGDKYQWFSSGSNGILMLPNIKLPNPNATKVYLNWFYSKDGQQAMVLNQKVPSRRLDVDLGSMSEYSRPRSDVEYININDDRFSAPDVTKAMRDDVAKWAGKA